MITAIFDLDGTIADTICDLGDAVNRGLSEMGCPQHDYETYKKMVGNGARKLCERALPEERKSETDRLHELFRQNYAENYLCKTKLYDGMADTLAALDKAGVVLAVATNKPQDFAVSIIDKLLPDVDFVCVLGGTEDRPPKPDTAIIVDILSRLPDEKNQVFMIGDSNVDIQTGSNAGIETIGCAWGFRGREELEREGADYIAEAPADIVGFVTGKKDQA